MELRQEIELLKGELLKKQMDLIEKIHSRRLGTLLQKQLEEVKEFRRLRDAAELKLKRTHYMNLDPAQDARINSVSSHQMMKLDEKYLGMLKDLKQHMMEQRRRLIVKHLEARNKEKLLRESWFEEAKAAKLAANFDELPLSETGFCLEEFTYIEGGKVGDASGSESVSSGPLHQQCGGPITIGSIECHYIGDTNICANYRNEGASSMHMESRASGHCSSNLNAAEFILPVKAYWGILATSACRMKSRIPLDTATMQSLSSSTSGAPNELDTVSTNSEVTARAKINLESEASHCPLDCTNAQVSMLGAIDTNLQETDRFNIALETETLPFPFSVNKVATNELDTVLTKSQVVAGVDLSLKQSLPPPTTDMTAVVDEIARTDASLEIAAGVGNALQTKTPPPSTARNVALSKVDARIANSEVTAGVNMVIEREPQLSPANVINAAAAADKGDAVEASLGPSYEVDNVLDGMSMSPEKTTARIELNIETETRDSPPNAFNMKATEFFGMNKSIESTAGLDCLRCHPTHSNCECSIVSSVESQTVLPSLAIQYPSTIRQAAVNELDARRGNSKILPSPSNATNPAPVNKLNVIGTVFGMPLECDNELDGMVTDSEAIARVEMTEETKNPHFSSNVINSGANVLVGMDENVRPTVVDSQQDQSRYSDYECVIIPPIQSQIELPSFSNMLTLGHVITTDQVRCPPCNAAEFVMDGPQNTLLLTSEREPSNEMDCSTRRTEVSIQQPAFTFVQMEPFNQLSLQSSLQPVALDANIAPGNTSSGELTSSLLSSLPSLIQPEHFPLPQLMHPQIIHPDPFENALMQISKQNELLAQEHENKKKQFRLDYERETQAIHRKYDALLQDIEANYSEDVKAFQKIKEKLHKNLILAEDFREKFMGNSGGTSMASHGANFGQYIGRALQQSNLTPTPASPVSATILPAPVRPSSSSLRLQAPTPAAKTSTPTSAARTSALPVQGFHYTSALSIEGGNYTSAFDLSAVSRPPSHPNQQVGCELRAPAPHLRLSRCCQPLSVPSRQPPSFPSNGFQTGSSLRQQTHADMSAASFANSHSCPPNVRTSRALTTETELERTLG